MYMSRKSGRQWPCSSDEPVGGCGASNAEPRAMSLKYNEYSGFLCGELILWFWPSFPYLVLGPLSHLPKYPAASKQTNVSLLKVLWPFCGGCYQQSGGLGYSEPLSQSARNNPDISPIYPYKAQVTHDIQSYIKVPHPLRLHVALWYIPRPQSCDMATPSRHHKYTKNIHGAFGIESPNDFPIKRWIRPRASKSS